MKSRSEIAQALRVELDRWKGRNRVIYTHAYWYHIAAIKQAIADLESSEDKTTPKDEG